jgi:serine/threonine-protein kinase mTOR
MSRDNLVQQFVQGLKSRSQQNKTAQELLLYVKTELREMPQDELLAFLDEFNHHIFDMISSADNSEKKGGVLAISEFFA